MKKLITSDLNAVTETLNHNNIALYTFDANVFYDTDAARRNYNDFKTELEHRALFLSDRNGLDYIVIFESETVKDEPYFKISHLNKMKKDALYGLCEWLDSYGLYDIEDETKATLIERLKNITKGYYYEQHYENESYHELDYDFSVTGYSQGDAFKVKLVGNVEAYYNNDYLTNIVYDTPLHASVQIYLNHNFYDELYIWEYADFNEYDYYDKDDFIKMISDLSKDKEYHDLLIEYLNDELPSEPSYH